MEWCWPGAALSRRDRSDSLMCSVRCGSWWRSSTLTVNCGSLAWGYGTDGSTDYLKVTHWETTWGKPGFFRLLRAVAVGKCGLLSWSTLLPSGFRSRRWNSCVLWVSCARRARGKVTRQLRQLCHCSQFGYFRRILRHFSRSSGCPGVERQFFELSRAHNCECSRAGGAGVAGSLLPGDSAPGLCQLTLRGCCH